MKKLDEKKLDSINNTFINLYLVSYAFLYIAYFLGGTMFDTSWKESFVFSVFAALAMLTIAIKMLFIEKMSRKELWTYVVLILIFLLSTLFSGYYVLLPNLIFILGAKNVPFRKIIWIFCIIGSVLLIITVIASQLGLIENLIYEFLGGTRISFGFDYTTTFTAHIFYLVMGYCYLKKGILNNLELGAIIGLAVISYVFCSSRLNAGCLILTFVAFLYLRIREKRIQKKGRTNVINPIFGKILAFAMPICAVFFIGLTLLYYFQETSQISQMLNNIFNNRLMEGSIGLQRYGVNLFGSKFDMVCYSGSVNEHVSDYFMLDCSYVMLLIQCGVIMLVTVLAIYVIIALRALKNQQLYLLIILALVSIQCMVELRLMLIAFNPFMLLLFAKMDNESFPIKNFQPRNITVNS